MPDTIDLLQIRIEKAKAELPVETVNAIAAIDWKAAILSLREKKGYSFEQLGDMELETELLLCGLVSPTQYPKELESRMKISPAEANELVNIMNEQVFAKIRGELVKNTEKKRSFNKGIEELPSMDVEIPQETREEVLQKIENPSLIGSLAAKPEPHPILAQKLSGAFKIPVVETKHSLDNLSKTSTPAPTGAMPASKPSADPYRELPE